MTMARIIEEAPRRHKGLAAILRAIFLARCRRDPSGLGDGFLADARPRAAGVSACPTGKPALTVP